MRRIATVVAALVLGMTALPAAATPGAFVGAEQMAEADWIVMNGDRGTFYFAIAWRSASDSGLITIGAVGKGRCERERMRHGQVISCHASGRGKELGPDQYEFDPALRSASMKFKSKSGLHRVRWEGRGRVPSFGGMVVGGDGYAFAGAGMGRSARADAQIFGRHLETKGWMSFAGLSQSAGAVIFTDYGRNIIVSPDGSFTIRVELKSSP